MENASKPVVEKKWFIVNVQSGCEATAKSAIEDRIRQKKMESFFGDILIPAENVVELVKGQKTTKSRKFFPGYIFVQMVQASEPMLLVKSASKVTGFVGSANLSDPRKVPTVPEHEVMRVTQQMAGISEKPKARANFSLGDQVTVVDGPFNNFNGTVEEINEEKAKVKVLVSIFGRPTPVELDFIQVEKG